MEYSLESNERTLVMFDSVCSGLTNCLALVHADIRHMTEHRNRLGQLEQEQIRAKCRSAQELFTMSGSSPDINSTTTTTTASGDKKHVPTSEMYADDECSADLKKRKQRQQQQQLNTSNKTDDSGLQDSTSSLELHQENSNSQYLAGLKFLDKRLAESFTQAFNANEEQKSSIAAKEQAYHSRPSIFQVLLGKTLSRRSSTSCSTTSHLNQLAKSRNNSKASACAKELPANEKEPDNKLIIDDINRQVRLAMQYIKQLESHLFKLEDLRPKYEMHLKMGLVVRHNNNNHYNSTNSLKSSKSKAVSESTLNSTTSYSNMNPSNRTTIKDFIENIAKIEQEFESYMGSFLLAIEDIQGFARVCQGDVFEITIKYGDSQKFKTRISVLKDNKQKCQNRQIVFKAKIADILAIKAYECKGLGKKLLLGHKLCETRDLFTAQSQLMTISLNQTGSIKLNMVVTWNPLHMAPATALSSNAGLDISHISLPPTPISSSTLSSLSSVPSINGTTTTINIRSSSQSRPRLNDSFNSQVDINYNQLRRQHHSPKHHNQRHSLNQVNPQELQHKQPALYQTVDPTYGYYIPAPDYFSNETKCSDY